MTADRGGRTKSCAARLTVAKELVRVGRHSFALARTTNWTGDRVSDGVANVQLRTGGFCHLDAAMVAKGLDALDLNALDVVLIENVGNLVCPAEFDTGAVKNAMILSVPEGDDKPLKYPLMFTVSDVLLVNKIDYLPFSDFNLQAMRERG